MHLAQDLATQPCARQMVQDGEGQHTVKGLAWGDFLPTRNGKVGRQEVNLQARRCHCSHRLAGFLQKLGAEVHPQVFSLPPELSGPGPFNRQRPWTAAKVEPPAGGRDDFQYPSDPGLDAPACLGKSLSKCLVELTVEREQPRGCRGLHALIIS